MPDLKASKPNEDDDDVKKLIIDHDYKKLLARNCCWAGLHTLCIGLFLFGYFAYPLCPYNQTTAMGFIFIGAMSFLTFWTYILIVFCDTLMFNEGITDFAEVFINKLNQANSLWFMVNATQWCLMLVGLIIITAFAAPLFQTINDDDEAIFDVIACTSYEKCCDKTIYILGHIFILLVWALYVIIAILFLVFYIVPACKRCCNKKKQEDDDESEGEGSISVTTRPSELPKPPDTTKPPSSKPSSKPPSKGTSPEPPQQTPTKTPTESEKPTKSPTKSDEPTKTPTKSEEPSKTPPETAEPTEEPTEDPTKEPSTEPSQEPSSPPSVTAVPPQKGGSPGEEPSEPDKGQEPTEPAKDQAEKDGDQEQDDQNPDDQEQETEGGDDQNLDEEEPTEQATGQEQSEPPSDQVEGEEPSQPGKDKGGKPSEADKKSK
ncbi:cell surface glycoprotein 1-like [Symsagittifera roscoffensis]|uniref:cell surface glycoprotein 1-like n=1 Tax=Symsagittifera roscoffensis TaxID=84072 RepID=UPI00307BD70C